MRYCPACKATYLSLTTCPRDGVRVGPGTGDPLIGEVLGGRYRVLDRVGAGGMGQVYRSAHARIASQFAVKVMYGDLAADRDMRARFEAEAESASVLQSRFITRVLDFGETDRGLLYLVMELLDGVSLTEAIARDGVLEVDRALRITRQIALGLAHAHERGIVHRDLKPDNVMLVTEDDGEEVAKILDFGIARMRSRTGLTVAGTVMGTPQYMSPEQFTGLNVDARSDLYSLGIVLYEALTGRPPFDAPSLPELFALHSQSPVPPIPGLTEGPVPQLLATLLAKSQDARFASARTLVEAIDKARREAPTRKLPAIEATAAPALNKTVVRSSRQNVASGVVAAIRAAIQKGAPLYNAGNHDGCADIYRDAAEALVAGPSGGAGNEAFHTRLAVSLRRASTLKGSEAAWELRYAFDDLMHVSAHPPELSEVTGLGAQVKDPRWLAWQLACAGLISARRQESRKPDRAAEYLTAFAEMLRARLRSEGTVPDAVAALDRALAAAAGQSPSQAVGALTEALESLRVAAPAKTGRVVARPSGIAQVPEIDRVVDAIVRAIHVGAAAYNAGDVYGCARLYTDTAEKLVQKLGNDPAGAPVRDALAGALEQVRTSKSPDDSAWALRHAFDSILAAASSR